MIVVCSAGNWLLIDSTDQRRECDKMSWLLKLKTILEKIKRIPPVTAGNIQLISSATEIGLRNEPEEYRGVRSLNFPPDDAHKEEMLRKTLSNVFKYKAFRPHQMSTITAVMNKKDVLLIAPTGRLIAESLERGFIVLFYFQAVEKACVFNCQPL